MLNVEFEFAGADGVLGKRVNSLGADGGLGKK
jgi:hypothetical protein